MNRNTELQLLSRFKDFTDEAVFIPAANSVVDWWLRSEGSNEWEYNARNLQWSGSLALALLLCKLALNPHLDEEVQQRLDMLFESANTKPTMTARSVAEDLEMSLKRMIDEDEGTPQFGQN